MIYIVVAVIASLVLNAPLGMAIGFVLALIMALAQSHGSMRERRRQVFGTDYLRAMSAFAIVSLAIDELDDWKTASIVWLIAAFALGAWTTHGGVSAQDRWALLSRFAAAVAGLSVAWLNMNWVTTPMPVWFILVSLVSASAVKAAMRWPNLPWIEHATPSKARTASAFTTVVMSAAIVATSVV